MCWLIAVLPRILLRPVGRTLEVPGRDDDEPPTRQLQRACQSGKGAAPLSRSKYKRTEKSVSPSTVMGERVRRKRQGLIEPTFEAWEANLKARKYNEYRVASVYARFGGSFCLSTCGPTEAGFLKRACKCNTCKALGFPAFPTTNQKPWRSLLRPGRRPYLSP